MSSPTIVRLDDRAGSSALYSPLLSAGLRVTMTRLPYGDVAFDGYGPDGVPIIVGIEHKQVGDVLKCIQDGRFAGHQLPGLLESYNYVYLVVEGNIRPSPGTGELQVQHQGRWFGCSFGNRLFRYVDLLGWLNSIEMRAGVRVRRCTDQQQSVMEIAGLYRWWGAGWDAHRAHLAFDLVGDIQTANLVRPGIVRRMAKELGGVGWDRSRHIAAVFDDVISMVAASEEEWQSIPGVGKVMAKRIRKELGWREDECEGGRNGTGGR